MREHTNDGFKIRFMIKINLKNKSERSISRTTELGPQNFQIKKVGY
jgi:hypothetical protein